MVVGFSPDNNLASSLLAAAACRLSLSDGVRFTLDMSLERPLPDDAFSLFVVSMSKTFSFSGLLTLLPLFNRQTWAVAAVGNGCTDHVGVIMRPPVAVAEALSTAVLPACGGG